MRTKSNTQIPSARSLSGEGWAAIIGAVGSVFLLAKKLLSPKPAHKPEWVTRPDFYAEMLATRERINATHLAILEKLDANYRELLCPGAAGHAHQYARSRPRPGGRRQSLRTMRAGVRQGACPLMHRIAVRGRMREKGLRTVPGLWLYSGVKTGGKAILLPESDGLCHSGRVNTVNRKRMQVIYSGQVQGVGFRYTVRTVATGFDVTGTIRNLPAGQVELIAEGARDELEAFRQAIRESGLDHFVRDEDVSWAEAAGEFRGFEIVR